MCIIRGKQRYPSHIVIFLLLVCFASGCLSYRTGGIPDVMLNRQDFLSDSKPTGYIEIKCQSKGFNETTQGKNLIAAQTFRGIVAGVLERAEPFKSYTFTERRGTDAEIKLVLYFELTETASLTNLLLSVGTFAIIPFTSSTTYHLNAQIYNKEGTRKIEYEFNDSTRGWVQILLLPIGPWKAPDRVEKALIENLINTTLSRMKADGLVTIPSIKI